MLPSVPDMRTTGDGRRVSTIPSEGGGGVHRQCLCPTAGQPQIRTHCPWRTPPRGLHLCRCIQCLHEGRLRACEGGVCLLRRELSRGQAQGTLHVCACNEPAVLGRQGRLPGFAEGTDGEIFLGGDNQTGGRNNEGSKRGTSAERRALGCQRHLGKKGRWCSFRQLSRCRYAENRPSGQLPVCAGLSQGCPERGPAALRGGTV